VISSTNSISKYVNNREGILSDTLARSKSISATHLSTLYLKDLQDLADGLGINRLGRKTAIIDRILTHIAT
jgi:hypothetical protein